MSADYRITDGVEDTTKGDAVDPEKKGDGEEEEQLDPKELAKQVKELSRKVEDAETRYSKAEEKASFWAEAATKKFEALPDEPKGKATADDVDDLEGVDLSDIIANNKTKDFAKIVDRLAEKKAQAIASSLIGQTTKEINVIQEYVGRYPDLADRNSEMTKRYLEIGEEMGKDRRFSGWTSAQIAERALERTEVEFIRAGKITQANGNGKETDEDVRQDREASRQAAIKAQSGGPGRKAAKPEGALAAYPPEQIALAEKIAKGMGVSVEKVIKQMPESRARTWR